MPDFWLSADFPSVHEVLVHLMIYTVPDLDNRSSSAASFPSLSRPLWASCSSLSSTFIVNPAGCVTGYSGNMPNPYGLILLHACTRGYLALGRRPRGTLLAA